MVKYSEKVPSEGIKFCKITEASLKKLLIKINFLVICPVSMSQKSLGTLGPI